MNFLQKIIDFVARPSHSRTMGLAVMLLLVTAVFLTVYVAQQQQQIRQRAESADCKQDYTFCVNEYNSCNQNCYALDQIKFRSYADYTKEYNACADFCIKTNSLCNASVDVEYSRCEASSTISIPTPTRTPTPPQIAIVPTSTPAPAKTTSPTSVPAPTSTPTPIPATTSCPTNDIGRCGAGTPPAPNCKGLLYSAGTPISNCTKELPNCWSCPQPTPTPVPSSANIGTEANPFQCVDQAGSFSGNYQCAGVTNASPQCPNTFSPFNFSPTFITSCGQNQVCCKQNPVTAPSPTPTPSPLPGSVQLALALTQQGLTNTPVNRSRSVTVVLQGADDQLITKTGTADFSNGKFNGTINLGALPSGSYKLKVKVGNFLKSLISNLAISGTTASAQTTIVAGLTDQFNDNVDAISFYNSGLRTCFGSTLGVKKCDKPEDVDLNGDANVDVIDYQTYLKGIRSLKQGLPVL